jgi:hypothetical protein
VAISPPIAAKDGSAGLPSSVPAIAPRRSGKAIWLAVVVAFAVGLAAGRVWGSGETSEPGWEEASAPPPAVGYAQPSSTTPRTSYGRAGVAGAARKVAKTTRFLAPSAALAGRRALNVMATTIQIAPVAFPNFETKCRSISPMLSSVDGIVMAGNFRDDAGNCYVWINLLQTEDIPAGDLCKVTLHELGHLAGYAHTPDAANVMHSPFAAKPTPPACNQRPSQAYGSNAK